MEQHIFEVTELNHLLKLLLDNEPLLQKVVLRGEISNWKPHTSGHIYFSLKDPGGALKCVMFRGNASKLRFRPENGMQVLATGRVSVYDKDGACQLYCDSLMPEGIGGLALAFEQLKEKLGKEGLFDSERKKRLPVYPRKIALVTAPTGAAVRDMIRILRCRYPAAKVIVMGVRV